MGASNMKSGGFASIIRYLFGYSLALIMLMGILAALFEDRVWVRIIGIAVAIVSLYINRLLWKKRKRKEDGS